MRKFDKVDFILINLNSHLNNWIIAFILSDHSWIVSINSNNWIWTTRHEGGTQIFKRNLNNFFFFFHLDQQMDMEIGITVDFSIIRPSENHLMITFVEIKLTHIISFLNIFFLFTQNWHKIFFIVKFNFLSCYHSKNIFKMIEFYNYNRHVECFFEFFLIALDIDDLYSISIQEGYVFIVVTDR